MAGSLENLPRYAEVMREKWDEDAYAVRDCGFGGRGVRGGQGGVLGAKVGFCKLWCWGVLVRRLIRRLFTACK